MKIGWFDPLMGGVGWVEYFDLGPAHMGRPAPPISGFTSEMEISLLPG